MSKHLKCFLVLIALQLAGEAWLSAFAASSPNGGSGQGGTGYKRDAGYKSISK